MDRFVIGFVTVNGVAQAASVGIGNRLLVGGNSATKSNVGGVSVSGDHGRALTAAGWIDDRDLLDTSVAAPVSLWSPRKEG